MENFKQVSLRMIKKRRSQPLELLGAQISLDKVHHFCRQEVILRVDILNHLIINENNIIIFFKNIVYN